MKPLVLLSFCLLSALGLPALGAQTATFTTFGASCGGAEAPTLTAQGLPRLGTTYTVQYAGPNQSTFVQACIYRTSRPIHFLGVSRTGWGSLQLPYLVPMALTNGDPGCNLLVSIEVATPMVQIGTTFVSTMPIPLPNDPALLGGDLFHQWATLTDRTAHPCTVLNYLHLSNGGHAHIGT